MKGRDICYALRHWLNKKIADPCLGEGSVVSSVVTMVDATSRRRRLRWMIGSSGWSGPDLIVSAGRIENEIHHLLTRAEVRDW